MRVFKFFDLKEGTETCVVCEERIKDAGNVVCTDKEEDCEIKDEVLNAMRVLGRIIIPAIIAFAIYLFLADRLYEIRGYYGIGSEIFLPSLIWYAGYRFIEKLF